ncbi:MULTISPECIES: methyl-accepting chemotaxis protein [Roseateles]|uniref:Methyl-accepting chemotaxis protein n=1 Tax=Pelomonas caseinilytica TaxID=2906763 RepID=A0ABS8XKD0_9BURK|nr:MULTISPECIES: methyl-accepting chemotaxis protein [unclassified Roseateles]MCE4539031.1 methyl-accepting chemotaxis protein [Pelomonas sp. P7]HEV6968944.1 methyl-accepting chemotaxis protein [Roseateles sp.]
MDLAKWMRSFTIRTRMHGAIAMVLCMFAALGLTGLLGGRQLMALNADLTAQSVSDLQHLAAIRQGLADVRLEEKEMVIAYESAEQVRELRGRWDAAAKRLGTSLQGLQEGRRPENKAAATEALKFLDDYRTAAQPVLGQIEAGGFDTARVADRMLNRPKAAMREVEQRVERLATLADQQAKAAETEFAAEMRRIAWRSIAVLGVVMLLVVPLTLINSHTITSPIRYASNVAKAIAGGDLNCTIRIAGRDEASDLLHALDAMQASLRGLVSQVKDSTLRIETASSEVASGNQDLSHRTEQAASSLQQTTNSMEDLTSGVRHGADAASKARELAAGAAEVARRGGEEVAKVVTTMDDINASSRRIGDILGLIDSIAFQTNILALNAAVEAARAGEQGRGFAVVASEVRALAQRSAGAAREIKSLITASVERTEAGAHLVQHAGATMDQIVEHVQKVSDMIGEVATGAADQSARIVQINGAVSHLEHMTQQNAALVEQSAAAADSLRQQLHLLTGAVAQFRLEGREVSPNA